MDVEVQVVLQRCHLIREGAGERLGQGPMETLGETFLLLLWSLQPLLVAIGVLVFSLVG